MKIESSNHISLKVTSNCSNFEGFYDCFAKKLIKLADFKHCTKKCLPSSWASTFSSIDSQSSKIRIHQSCFICIYLFLFLTVPFCEEFDDDICAMYALRNSVGSSLMQYLSLCPKSCSSLEYTGSVDYLFPFKGIFYRTSNVNTTYFSLVIRYKPPGNEFVYEEYLIVDFYGMVGVVGGTLGLFVGFSFFNIIPFFIDLIKRMYNKYKNPIITEEMISSKMIKGEENENIQIQYIVLCKKISDHRKHSV